MREGGLAAPEDAGNVDSQHPVPSFGRYVGDVLAPRHPGDVGQDVQPAVRGYGVVYGGAALVAVRNVTDHGGHSGSKGLYQPRHLCQALDVSVEANDDGPVLGHPESSGPPDAGGCTGE